MPLAMERAMPISSKTAMNRMPVCHGILQFAGEDVRVQIFIARGRTDLATYGMISASGICRLNK